MSQWQSLNTPHMNTCTLKSEQEIQVFYVIHTVHIQNKAITRWWWHPGAETCRSLIIASECILLNAYVGWCINYKHVHGTEYIFQSSQSLSWSWNSLFLLSFSSLSDVRQSAEKTKQFILHTLTINVPEIRISALPKYNRLIINLCLRNTTAALPTTVYK